MPLRPPFSPAFVLPLAAALALVATCAVADTVRLSPGQPLARMALLKPGVHRYLRYTVATDGARKAIDIWVRTVSVAPPAQGQAPQLHIAQRWDEVDGALLIQDSWFDPATFAPKTHVRRLTRDGKTTIGGYLFTPGKVVGMPELPDNGRKDFTQALPEASYNFEYDMEFLQALPLAAGRTFDIPFYDPGQDQPGRYRFVVAGSERIAGPDGRPIDCWLVTADYNTGKLVSRFWFAKSDQVLIREAQARDGGGWLIKALLPPESADAP
ncbi:MAG: hypothetical protein JF588_22325 [Caulobacterales bacterium]|nr:hypothetical protein [Caulobacterales bacterium]